MRVMNHEPFRWRTRWPVVLALLVGQPACGQTASPPVDVAVALRNRIRAGYLGQQAIAAVPRMAEVGLNAAVVKFQGLRAPMTGGQREALRAWSQACSAHNLLLLPTFDLWGERERRGAGNYRVYVDRDKPVPDAPCPLNPSVYDALVHRRLVELARLSTQLPIAGAILDVELYASSFNVFPDVCTCDSCWQSYRALRESAGETEAPDLPVSQRWKFLSESGQLSVYRRFTTETIAWLAGRTRREVASIAPTFVIGMSLGDVSVPYTRGLVKGLGTPDNPVWVLTEQTYENGYTGYVPDTIKRFAAEGRHVRLVTGIWQGKFPTANLPEQYYHCAKASAGYFIYSVGHLNGAGPGRLPEPDEAYWNAMRTANRELDRLAKNANYRSKLLIRPFHPPAPAIGLPDLRGVEYVLPRDPEAIKAEGVTLRRANTLVFLAKKGDRIKFAARVNQLVETVPPEARMELVAADGARVAEAVATNTEAGLLEAVAPKDGAYAVVLAGGRHSVTLMGHSHPYSIYGGESARLMRLQHRLYVWKPAGVAEGQIEFWCDGRGEAYEVTFRTLSGRELGSVEVVTHKIARIRTGPSAQGEVIQMAFKALPGARIEDVRVRPVSGFGLYVAPERCGLVRDAAGAR